MTRRLRIATRPTELALRRSRAVQAMLEATGVTSELVIVRTAGDRHFAEPFQSAAARNVFTQELEDALVRRRADLAVHAYPDVPADPASGTTIAAVPRRGDPRDALVLNSLLEGTSPAELPRGTRLGTSSVRCRALLRALYPEIEVVQLRGDLPDRLRKVDDGQVHATIVSADALHHLAVSQRIAGYLEPPAWLPAPAQAALALQVRDDDGEAARMLAPLSDVRTLTDVTAERKFFSALEGALQSPVAALVVERDGARELHGMIADPDGRVLLRASHALDDTQPELAGIRLANELRAQGASRILDAVRRAERVSTPQPDST
ncbi:MAG TPA: hydroxymethylbilane synthase [Gemmatimonadaceae bacterium]|nr:hydroxymethylbilane synthase [Gemmatimonadaceae bacterium]